MTKCPYCNGGRTISDREKGVGYCWDCHREFLLSAAEETPGRKELTAEDLDRTLPEGQGLKLFLSYPHKRAEVCEEIYAALKKRGHDVWYDREQLSELHGADWRREIYEGIRESKAVLSCLSSEAVRKENGQRGVCLDELSIAVSVRGGNIKTVLLEPESKVNPNASLTHGQWLDMSDWQAMKARGEAAYRPWFLEKMLEILKMLESEDTYQFDGEIRRVMAKLDKAEFRASKGHLLEKPFEGREWLAEAVDAWLDEEEGGGVCALYGGPGVGKSAFAARYAFESPHVAAILFFEYEHPTYNTPRAMAQALAYQLACRLPDYRRALLDVLEKPGAERAADDELLDLLVIRPLRYAHIDGEHERLCVIIDGLDECGRGEVNEAARVLRDCAEKFPRFLRVLVCSRKENAVTHALTPRKVIEIEEKGEENLRDIRAYLEKQLTDVIPDPGKLKAAAEALTERCEGAFLYAELAARALREGTFDHADPDAYPRGLGQMIGKWFERLFPDIGEYKKVFRLPLSAVLCSPEPLPEEELERLLGMEEAETRDLVRRLAVFLTYGADPFGRPTISFAHRYVQDWLASPEEAGAFFLSRRDGLAALAKGMADEICRNAASLTCYEARYAMEFMEQAGLKEELNAALRSREYIICMDLYGKWARDWGRMGLADVLFRQSLRIAEIRAQGSEDPEDRNDLSVSYGRVAGILERQGQIDEALELYRKSLSIVEGLAAERGLPEDRSSLSAGFNQVGGVLEIQGHTDEAMELYKKSLAIAEGLAAERGQPEDRRTMLVPYGKVARILEKQGRNDEALELYRKSLAISEGLAAERGLPEDRRDLLVSYGMVAGILEKQGRNDEALELYRKSLAIAEELAVERGLLGDLRDMSVGYEKVGGILEKQGRTGEALGLYRKSLAIREKIAAERGLPEDRWDLSRCFNDVAMILEKWGRNDEALELYRKSLAIREILMEERGLPEDRRDVSVSYGKVAGILKKQGRDDEALEQFRKSLAIAEELAVEHGLPEDRRGLSRCFNNVAMILEKWGRNDEALELYRKSLAIREKLTADRGLPKDCRDLLFSYGMVGGILEKQGQNDEALKLYRKSLAIAEELAVERGLPEDRRDLSVCYEKVAGILEKQGQNDEALELYRKSLAIREILMEERGLPEDRRDLSGSYNIIAGILEKQGQTDEALELYRKSLAIAEGFATERGLPEDRRDLSISYGRVAGILEKQGRTDEALELYRTSLAIAKDLAAKQGLPDDDWIVIVLHYKISILRQKMKQWKEAVKEAKEALDLCERLAERVPGYREFIPVLERTLREAESGPKQE